MQLYKETEFKKVKLNGRNIEIPKDWEVVKLEDVIIEAKPGFACGKRDDNGIIQLRMDSIDPNGRINPNAYVKVPLPENLEEYLLKPGDILFVNTIGSLELLGKSAIFKGEHTRCTYSNHLTRIRVNFNKTLPEWILYHLIRYRLLGIFQNLCHRHAGGQAMVSRNDLLNLEIPLSPLEEQKAIAQILSTVDEAIQKVNETIEKAERLKKGLMQELLTGKVRVRTENGRVRFYRETKFRDSEIGKVPEDWEVIRLGEALEICQYGLSVPIKDRGKYPIIKMDDIVNGYVVPRSSKYVDLDEKTFKSFKLEKGDILINRTNAPDLVGRTGIFLINGDFVFASYLIRLRPKRNMFDPHFLTFYLIFSHNKIKQLATRAVQQANINATNLKKLNVPVPPLEEQKQIAEILSTVDKLIEVRRKQKDKLERVKKGLMNILLTGRVRVVVNGERPR